MSLKDFRWSSYNKVYTRYSDRNHKMKRNMTFITPEKTRENQESMKQHGIVSTYYGLFVFLIVAIGFALNYFFGIK